MWLFFYRVDYGHEEVKVKFGNDPRKFSTLTKEFLDDGKSLSSLLRYKHYCDNKISISIYEDLPGHFG